MHIRITKLLEVTGFYYSIVNKIRTTSGRISSCELQIHIVNFINNELY